MIKFKIILLIFSLTIITYSCISFDIHKHFTLYKLNSYIKGNKQIKTNGIYFVKGDLKKNKHFPIWSFMYLYTNDDIYIDYDMAGHNDENSTFWENPEAYLLNLKKRWSGNWIGKTKDTWGSYIVRNDSIFIQYFCSIPSSASMMTRNSINVFGIIKNDSTILIYEEDFKWCKYYGICKECKYKNKRFYNPMVEYQFYKTNFKPDSTNAWFKQTRWYKKWKEDK